MRTSKEDDASSMSFVCYADDDSEEGDSGVDTNVVKLLPDLQECKDAFSSDKQESLEDALSTGSVDYDYSEEDVGYYSEEDQDIKEGKVGISIDSTATKKNKEEIISTTDVADCVDTEWEEDEDSKEGKVGISIDSTATKKNKEIISTTVVADCVDTEWKAYLASHRMLNKPVEICQPQNDWVDSWKVSNHQTPFVWVNVYAYYNRDKHYGGYGVILRDSVAKPIAALTNFTSCGVSFFTQVLMGIKAGLTLAENYGLSELRVRCNSFKVPGLVSRIFKCRSVKCRIVDDPCDSRICRTCRDYFSKSEGCSLGLVRHVREIKFKTLRNLVGISMGLNRAAYYLAKMGKKGIPEVVRKPYYPVRSIHRKDAKMGKKGRPEVESKKVLECSRVFRPDDFPQELRSILWDDAFCKEYYNEDWIMQYHKNWMMRNDAAPQGLEMLQRKKTKVF